MPCQIVAELAMIKGTAQHNREELAHTQHPRVPLVTDTSYQHKHLTVGERPPELSEGAVHPAASNPAHPAGSLAAALQAHAMGHDPRLQVQHGHTVSQGMPAAIMR